MVDVKILKYPKCPKCKSDMVPLSSVRGTSSSYCPGPQDLAWGTPISISTSGTSITVFDKWKCVKCGYTVES